MMTDTSHDVTTYEYWNTVDDEGLTRRQRKWATMVGVPATLVDIAARPCLANSAPPGCSAGSCVTCEARSRMAGRRLFTCEQHPDRLWSGAHDGSEGLGPVCPDGCAGPGMPLAESLRMLGFYLDRVRAAEARSR